MSSNLSLWYAIILVSGSPHPTRLALIDVKIDTTGYVRHHSSNMPAWWQGLEKDWQVPGLP